MKTYSVWFHRWDRTECLFITSVPGYDLAMRIAGSLVEEFTEIMSAWAEED